MKMGLDMYLEKETYIGNREKNNGVVIIVEGVDSSKVRRVVEEVCYWRKANAIHKWFVENVQDGNDDCGRYYVSQEEMKELLNVIKKVLRKHSLAEELLPSASGFFFGSTGYDEYYFDELKSTAEVLEKVSGDEYGSYVYHSSW